MHLSLLKTKIHRATVTHRERNYESPFPSTACCRTRHLVPRIRTGPHIPDVTNGARFSTYGSARMRAADPAQRRRRAPRAGGRPDHDVAFASMSEQEADQFQPTLVYVDGQNRITHTNRSIPKQAAPDMSQGFDALQSLTAAARPRRAICWRASPGARRTPCAAALCRSCASPTHASAPGPRGACAAGGDPAAAFRRLFDVRKVNVTEGRAALQDRAARAALPHAPPSRARRTKACCGGGWRT